MNYLLPERLDRLAREFALGTLSAPARRRFERVLSQSAQARAAVLAWQGRLALLEAGAPQVAPRPGVWTALERRLDAQVQAQDTPAQRTQTQGSHAQGVGLVTGTAPGQVPAQTPGHAPEQSPGQAPRHAPGGRAAHGGGPPAGSPPAGAGWTAWLPAWARAPSLSAGFAGAALCAVFCAVLLRIHPGLVGLEPAREGLPASYVGLLADTGGRPAVLASARRHGRQLTVKLLQPLHVPAGRVAQLWALPQDGGAPFPVAVVPASGTAVAALDDQAEKLFFKVSRLAVSFEPAPARPGAAPQAEFVLSGHCVKLW